MNIHLLAVYVVAVFLAMIAPGPDMMFILATGARGGPRAGRYTCCTWGYRRCAARGAAARPPPRRPEPGLAGVTRTCAAR